MHLPQEDPSSQPPESTVNLHSTTVESPEVQSTVKVPEEYRVFQDMFSKQLATKLPPHRSWDCAIELVPDATQTKDRMNTSRRRLNKGSLW